MEYTAQGEEDSSSRGAVGSASGRGEPAHLAPSEADRIRAALADRRKGGGYVPGKWSVSPLNRQADVLAGRVEGCPARVGIRDITLRVIEQAPGVRLTSMQRRALGDRLLDAGVRRVEVSAHGWGVDEDELRRSVARWRSRVVDLEVKVGATQTPGMVADADRVGATLVTHWIPAVPELSPVYWPEAYRKAWSDGDWRDGSVPTNSRECIVAFERVWQEARERGLEIAAGINLLAFATPEWLAEFLDAMKRFLPDEVWLSDGSSGLGPEAWVYVVRRVCEALPGARVGIYTKNAYGLGVASLIAAARAGAQVLETSVNGFSMASGQPDTACLATALEVLYGVSTDICLERLTELAEYVAEATGHHPEPWHPVVGAQVHNWGGAEFISQERKLDRLIHWSYDPAIVGSVPSWDVTPLTGMWGISEIVRALDLPHDDAVLPAIREEILRQSALRGRALRLPEIRELCLLLLADEEKSG